MRITFNYPTSSYFYPVKHSALYFPLSVSPSPPKLSLSNLRPPSPLSRIPQYPSHIKYYDRERDRERERDRSESKKRKKIFEGIGKLWSSKSKSKEVQCNDDYQMECVTFKNIKQREMPLEMQSPPTFAREIQIIQRKLDQHRKSIIESTRRTKHRSRDRGEQQKQRQRQRSTQRQGDQFKMKIEKEKILLFQLQKKELEKIQEKERDRMFKEKQQQEMKEIKEAVTRNMKILLSQQQILAKVPQIQHTLRDTTLSLTHLQSSIPIPPPPQPSNLPILKSIQSKTTQIQQDINDHLASMRIQSSQSKLQVQRLKRLQALMKENLEMYRTLNKSQDISQYKDVVVEDDCRCCYGKEGISQIIHQKDRSLSMTGNKTISQLLSPLALQQHPDFQL